MSRGLQDGLVNEVLERYTCEELDVVVYTRNPWGGRERVTELAGQPD